MVIFGYINSPSCGWEDYDDGGFSCVINSEGILEYKTYIFSNKEKSCKTYYISKNTVNHIEKIILKNQKIIDRIPENLDNGSCDGELNEFVFYNKRISALNIEHINANLIMILNFKYYVEYRKNIKNENDVMKIFNKICELLKEEDIFLSLNSFSVGLSR